MTAMYHFLRSFPHVLLSDFHWNWYDDLVTKHTQQACALCVCILDSYILVIKTVKGVCFKPFCLSHWYQISLHIIYTDPLFWGVEVLLMCRLPLWKITKSLVSSWEITVRKRGRHFTFCAFLILNHKNNAYSKNKQHLKF